LAADFTGVNVARQADDPASLFSFYRRAIWFRKSAPALLEGSYRGLDSPPDTFVFVREHGAQRLLVALNFGAEPRTIELPATGKGGVALSTDAALTIAGSRIVLRPATGAVIEL
jgi:alpha-glucosidase